MTTCAAAIAPVNFDVFTVKSAFGATTSARTCEPELRLNPWAESK